MKKVPTLFLKLVLAFIGLAVLAFCIFALPAIGRGAAAEFPNIPYLKYSILIGYATAVPFFFALYQAFRLLSYIDTNTAFSVLSVGALRKIKYCAILISVFYATGLPFAYAIAESDDAPGLVLIALTIVGAPIVVAVFAAVLEKLVRSAIEIKSENELTV